MAATSEQCTDSVRSLRNDVSMSVTALQEQKQQSELAAVELRTTVRDAEAATTQRLDDLVAKVEVRWLAVSPALYHCSLMINQAMLP